MDRKKILLTLTAVLCLLGTMVTASEYEIGTDDVLEIKFWQDPSLNSIVKVSQDGMITLDVIGQIEAAGKTSETLQSDIIKQMSRLNTRVSQVVVRIYEFNYQHVFVKGQVLQKGKQAFEKIPDLWTIINEAGGATEFGDLSRVTIIRGGDDAGKVEQVDLLKAIELGQLGNLPKIYRQDVIEIPRTPIGIAAGDISDQIRPDKNVFYVLGAVNNPGPIRFQNNIDLLEAIALAGGPTSEADYSKAKIVSKDGQFGKTLQIDLDRYTKSGYPARYFLKSEDTFILPSKKRGGLGLGSIIQILGAASTAIILYDRLKTD